MLYDVGYNGWKISHMSSVVSKTGGLGDRTAAGI